MSHKIFMSLMTVLTIALITTTTNTSNQRAYLADLEYKLIHEPESVTRPTAPEHTWRRREKAAAYNATLLAKLRQDFPDAPKQHQTAAAQNLIQTREQSRLTPLQQLATQESVPAASTLQQKEAVVCTPVPTTQRVKCHSQSQNPMAASQTSTQPDETRRLAILEKLFQCNPDLVTAPTTPQAEWTDHDYGAYRNSQQLAQLRAKYPNA